MLKSLRETVERENSSILLAWFDKYFEIMVAANETELTKAIERFKHFYQLLKQHQLISDLSPPPNINISFQYTELDYLYMACYALEKSANKSMQANYLNELPEFNLIESAFNQGYAFIVKQMIFNEEVMPYKTDNLFNFIDINLAYSRILIQLAEQPQKYKICELFTRHLRLTPNTQLNSSDKLILLKLIARYFIQSEQTLLSEELAQLLTLAIAIKQTLGVKIYYQLFADKLFDPSFPLNNYLITCQNLLEMKEDRHSIAALFNKLSTLTSFHAELIDTYNQYLERKYPERDIDTVINTFSETNDIVRFPLTTAELAAIKSEYQQIHDLLKIRASKPSDNSIFNQDKLTRLTIIIETIRRIFKITPHDTQLVAILALLQTPPNQLKGRIAQIKTGEGKSMIIAIIAAYAAAQGDFVDVITSSANLALRDQQKFSEFFSALGISSSYISDHSRKPKDFHGQILYGTNTSFEFAYMFDGLDNLGLRNSVKAGKLQPRTFDSAIIDEADNLFIDTAANSARISMSSDENISWIYAPILKFTQQCVKIRPNYLHVKLLRGMLNSYQSGKYQAELEKLSDKRLLNYLTSAVSSLFYQEGKQYIMRNERDEHDGLVKSKIIIMDYEITGRANEGSQWSHGLHQFVEIKHGITPSHEDLTAASLSHVTFFSKYRQIIGLTGTMGELVEREEILKIYRVDSFDVPPHRTSQRKRLPGTIHASKKEQFQALLKNIQEMQHQNRATLVLFETVNDSNAYSQFLSEQGISHQLLNETQRETEDYIVARAGESKRVTVATNTAGRGTDIILSPQVLENEGLYVSLGFFPKNLRVEEQNFGRAGRQGQPGSGDMHLCVEDPLIKRLLGKEINTESTADFYQALYKKRSENIAQESRSRIERSQIESLLFQHQELFFNQLKELNTWFSAESFLKQLTELCTQFHQSETLGVPLSHAIWPDLYKKAILLLEQPSVDWKGFVTQFKHDYIEHVKRIWAKFFTELEEKRDECDLNAAKIKTSELHQKMYCEMEQFIATKDHIVTWLSKLLVSARLKQEFEEPKEIETESSVSSSTSQLAPINNSFTLFANSKSESKNEEKQVCDNKLSLE